MSKKVFTGIITSDKMQKTVVVAVDMHLRHPIYNKIIKNTKKFKAHNLLEAKTGQNVVIEECKPFSKDVCWNVIKIVEKESK